MNPVSLIDVPILCAACPERSPAELAPWVAPVQAACVRFEMNTVRRVAAFIAQMAHESGLTLRSENLNYSAKRMAEVWPGRFAVNPHAPPKDCQPNALARSLEHNPEKLANYVYANRMGNGPPESGDGWRFRAFSPLQVTGRKNITAFAAAMGMSLEAALAYMQTLEGGIMASAWFWEENDINRLADTPGVADETRRINGGETGFADRKARFDATVKALLAKGA